MENQIFGPVELPSGKSIKFREPKGIDRVNVITSLKASSDSVEVLALLVDGYSMVKCITEYDNKETDGNFKRLYQNMNQEDLDYYRELYHEMFGITKEKRAKIQETADFLRGKPTCTDSSN